MWNQNGLWNCEVWNVDTRLSKESCSLRWQYSNYYRKEEYINYVHYVHILWIYIINLIVSSYHIITSYDCLVRIVRDTIYRPTAWKHGREPKLKLPWIWPQNSNTGGGQLVVVIYVEFRSSNCGDWGSMLGTSYVYWASDTKTWQTCFSSVLTRTFS